MEMRKKGEPWNTGLVREEKQYWVCIHTHIYTHMHTERLEVKNRKPQRRVEGPRRQEGWWVLLGWLVTM